MGSPRAEWVCCYNVGKDHLAELAPRNFNKKHVTFHKVFEGLDHSELLREGRWQVPECSGFKAT